ncbi:diacylglycerol/lipid kinase family protein [Algoriphagus sp. NG3]|uniref:diacylglycerol/lipid kinase family protein n=1 Tax=unclassified Algoriphagus TaxID=2641541 RepID=UPI002A8145CC|nr:diacylglycerol kinase family protein [Algoriphagus sp. NG3]WPR73861.1 diacylglycerol kinase family protein [Algoriphagus sp. NG3]
MLTCLFVYNPISGDNGLDREELDEMIEEKLGDYSVHLYETSGADDHKSIQQQIQNLNPDLVIAAGGDGTVKLVAASMEGPSIPIAIIPLGSANGLAKCMGIGTLEDSWEVIRRFKVQDIDSININGEICLHLADFGINANLIQKFEQDESRGMLGYVKHSFGEIFGTDSMKFKLKIENEIIDLTAKMVVIANGDRYGTGAVVNCKGVMDDGKFEVIAINPETAEHYLKMTLAFMTGDLDEVEGIKSWSVSKCEISNLEGAEFQIDGEIMKSPSQVSVKIEKHAFKFLVGESFTACQTSLN